MSQEPNRPVGYLNVPFKTLGGQQFWTDMRWLDGWHVQKNHMTGHFRLLDPNNVRQAWGNQAHCDQELNAIATTQNLTPYSGRIAILVHGLNREHASMQAMADHLTGAGFQVINFQYASGRATMGDHAVALDAIIQQLGDEVTEINFVGHSMGNIVVRHYLKIRRAPEHADEEGDPRIKRMVMLGPPNQGSKLASLFKNSLIFSTVAGASGQQLGTNWETLEPELATPFFEFGIIAGGIKEDATIKNPLLNGENDLIVSVEETKLPGARDMVIKPFNHTFIMSQPESLELTLRFLNEGFFLNEKQRNPLPLNDGN